MVEEAGPTYLGYDEYYLAFCYKGQMYKLHGVGANHSEAKGPTLSYENCNRNYYILYKLPHCGCGIYKSIFFQFLFLSFFSIPILVSEQISGPWLRRHDLPIGSTNWRTI